MQMDSFTRHRTNILKEFGHCGEHEDFSLDIALTTVIHGKSAKKEMRTLTLSSEPMRRAGCGMPERGRCSYSHVTPAMLVDMQVYVRYSIGLTRDR